MSLSGSARPPRCSRYGFFGCAGADCEFAGACCAGCCPAGALLDGGALGCEALGCGVAVCGVAGTGLGTGLETCCRTDPPCSTPLSVRRTRAIAHTMNMMAHQVVALDKIVAAPRGPKAVWLPAPPKAPAISAALPLCSSTTMIRNKQLITKNVGSRKESHEFESLQPRAINPNPRAKEIAHFIQPGM